MVAPKDSYKTTLLFHLLHNSLEDTQETAVVVTPKSSLYSKSLFFGRYSPVDIEALSRIGLKLIDSYEELVQYLLDFHLLPSVVGTAPLILAIDSANSYFD
eukprot:TRINITY_DN14058_c0_g3_i14.p4 TRINITY_DN14058_c0_g3~~TRINITY_DN14058_c0_g3_i14.p4  ORF type:complete len:101 (-),score=34.08 TRINITY_DN14058_c0_g3_i14:447-749(-)